MAARSLTAFFSEAIPAGRLTLRKFKSADAAAIHSAAQENNGEMLDFFIIPHEPFATVDDVKDYALPAIKSFEISQDFHYLGAFRTGAPDRMIGMLGFTRDRNRLLRAAYFIRKSERRRGYAREMYTHLMQTISRKLEQHQMVAEVEYGNTASLAMLRSLGFSTLGIRTATANKHDDRRMIALRKTI